MAFAHPLTERIIAFAGKLDLNALRKMPDLLKTASAQAGKWTTAQKVGAGLGGIAGAGILSSELKKARAQQMAEITPGMIELGKLDLGREPMDYCGAVAGPAMPKPRKWYPNLYIDGSPNPIDLPDSGKATIEYKVTRKTTTDSDGKKRHEASLEIHSIEPVEKKSEVRSQKSEAGRVNPLKFSALAPRMIQFERPRNTDGEFAPQAEGVPDPSTMRAAYGHQPSSGLAKAGKVAGAAAGLGGTAAAALLLARKLRKA